MSKTDKRYLGFIPVPALLFIVALLHFIIKPSLFYEPSWLLPVTNTLFVTVVCFVIAYIAIRNYKASGRIQVLLLGCGVFAFGIAAVLAAFLRNVPETGANLNVTVYNTGALVAAIFHFVAALILLSGISIEVESKRKGLWVIGSYAGLAVFMGFFTVASIRGMIPPFFVQGVGATLLRQEVLGTADILFAFSFLIFMGAYLKNRETFLYWYASALALTSISLTGFFIQSAVGSPIGWASRFSQYLGGIYFLIAVLAAVRGSQARHVSLDRVLTAALSPAEEKFRALSENSPDGISRFDRELRHIYVNQAGIKLYRKPAGSIMGRTIMDSGLPEDYGRVLRERIETVFTKGQPTQIEAYVPAGNGTLFYQSRCVPEYGPDGRVANVLVISRDLTERKRAEEEVRESRAKLEAALASMSDAVFISDAEGRFVEFNDAFATYHRFRNKEECYKTLAEYPDYIDVYFADGTHAPLDMWAVPRALRGETVSNAEYMLRRKDTGETWWGSYNFAPIRDKAGTIVGSVVTGRDITDQKRTEEALRESKARLDLALQSAEMGAWHWDVMENKRYFDDQVCRLLGIDPMTFTGSAKQFYDRVHPDDREMLKAALVRTIEQDVPYEPEYRAVWPDGSVHYIAARGRLVRHDASNKPERINGLIWDITERKRAEEALRESEEHYRSLFDNMLNGFAFCKMLFEQGRPKDFIYLSVNSAFEALTGLKDVTGKTVSEVIPGIQESDPELFEIYGRVALTGTPERFERYIAALGMWFAISVYSPRKEHFVAVFYVITERKRAEEALQKAHDELEQRVKERTEELQRQVELLNLTHDAVIAHGLNQRVFFWNRGAEERYGWTSDEVKGEVTDDLLHTVFPQPRQEIEEELLLHGRWEGEVMHTTRDGRKITVASRRALRRDKDGKPIAILEINSDITEQKRIEERLRQSQKMEAVGTLAGGIAHDFNNILAAIIGFSEMAADEIPADSGAQHHLKRVLKAGMRGRELVKQILAFSRKKEGERKQISLTPLVHETYALLRSSLPTTVQMPLAITTGDDYVSADPTQLQQVLMNLATNGAHAMPDGGQLTIGLSSVTFSGDTLPDPDMEPGAYVKLTVKDTGTGMTEEVRQRIFEPFFTTKEPGKGTRMGLAVVYGIVKSHGGAVTVTSQLSQGSTFEVFLPRVEKPEVGKEETTISALPTGTERILFVDDEELLVEMGRDMLKSLGYHVTVAQHPTDAWNQFLEDPSRFDIVISDQTMPGMTGVTLALKMLRARPEMPIILCTGHSDAVSADKAKEVGICEFVMKPMLKKELAETVRRALDRRKE